MKLLALDSSGLVASAAILHGEEVVAEYTVNYKKTHSQTLLPMVDEIVKMTETDLTDMDAIAVAAGPGSFTGLRIGSATAKGLGLALNKDLISVPTLEGLAYNYYGYPGLICPVMDARRQQVYTGIYRFEGDPSGTDSFKILQDQTACPVEEITDKLNQIAALSRESQGFDSPVIFLGDGVPAYRDLIQKGMKVPFLFAPPQMNRQRAASVGKRGMDLYAAGKKESAADHSPVYIRKSQAERELIARGGSLEKEIAKTVHNSIPD